MTQAKKDMAAIRPAEPVVPEEPTRENSLVSFARHIYERRMIAENAKEQNDTV
jgi:hypothetical protein